MNGEPTSDYQQEYLTEIQSAKSHGDLTAISQALSLAFKNGKMDKGTFHKLVEAGKKQRAQLGEVTE